MLFDNRYKNANIVSRTYFWVIFKVQIVVTKVYKMYNKITNKITKHLEL